MNIMKLIFSAVIIFFSLSFLLSGGWGIIALFYAIAYLILILTKAISNIKTNDKSKPLIILSDFIVKKEMITEDEFNNIKEKIYELKL